MTRVALVSILALAAAPAFAQLPPSTSDIQVPTFRSGASLVSLNVTVMDGGARYVIGLQPADFAVFEDGVKQDVRFFESTNVPVDLFVLLDTSASMETKLQTAQDAAIGFTRRLRPQDLAEITAPDPAQVNTDIQSARSAAESAQTMALLGVGTGVLGLLAAAALWLTRPRSR